jgi:hypothetical protein
MPKVSTLLLTLALVSCGKGTTTIGGNPPGDAGPRSSTDSGHPPDSGPMMMMNNDGGTDGGLNNCPDSDGDHVTTCGGDCNDADNSVHPGATETVNTKDDDCDGVIDANIPGLDYDKDGAPFPQDCNDLEPLVSPNSMENPSNGIDDDCDGTIDEANTGCDAQITGNSAMDFAKAIGICEFVTAASFNNGVPTSRRIVNKLGDSWGPKQGSSLAMLSSGEAVDNHMNSGYVVQPGMQFYNETGHPLYSNPKCGAPSSVPNAKDITELDLTIKVPANAQSFSFQFAYFTAEYPEYLCTQYNDRFIALLESSALSTSSMPAQQCVSGAATTTCNISFDGAGQPITVNNAFFEVCDSFNGMNTQGVQVVNNCSQSASLLNKTGYDRVSQGEKAGGGTGWLTTQAPVTPGETITLRFIVFDEGDYKLDSAALIDNFQWHLTTVTGPSTMPTP